MTFIPHWSPTFGYIIAKMILVLPSISEYVFVVTPNTPYTTDQPTRWIRIPEAKAKLAVKMKGNSNNKIFC